VNSSTFANIPPWRATLVLALAGATFGALTGATFGALAQEAKEKAQTPEVTVKVQRLVRTKNRHSVTGIHDETVSLTRTIGYSDLNLASVTDEKELEARIADDAEEICAELGRLFPAGSIGREQADRAQCVKEATERAMADARVAIASQQQGHALR
jgi:UrcA family protein